MASQGAQRSKLSKDKTQVPAAAESSAAAGGPAFPWRAVSVLLVIAGLWVTVAIYLHSTQREDMRLLQKRVEILERYTLSMRQHLTRYDERFQSVCSAIGTYDFSTLQCVLPNGDSLMLEDHLRPLDSLQQPGTY